MRKGVRWDAIEPDGQVYICTGEEKGKQDGGTGLVVVPCGERCKLLDYRVVEHVGRRRGGDVEVS